MQKENNMNNEMPLSKEEFSTVLSNCTPYAKLRTFYIWLVHLRVLFLFLF